MNESPALLRPLLGLVPFNARKGHGSFVTFGLTTTPEAPSEEFYFWIYLCRWRIGTTESELAHSESTDSDIASAVSMLNGRKLEGIVLQSFVTLEGLFHGALLIFADGITMKLLHYDDSPLDYPIFMTHNTADQWISYYADGSIQTATKG